MKKVIDREKRSKAKLSKTSHKKESAEFSRDMSCAKGSPSFT